MLFEIGLGPVEVLDRFFEAGRLGQDDVDLEEASFLFLNFDQLHLFERQRCGQGDDRGDRHHQIHAPAKEKPEHGVVGPVQALKGRVVSVV